MKRTLTTMTLGAMMAATSLQGASVCASTFAEIAASIGLTPDNFALAGLTAHDADMALHVLQGQDDLRKMESDVSLAIDTTLKTIRACQLRLQNVPDNDRDARKLQSLEDELAQLRDQRDDLLHKMQSGAMVHLSTQKRDQLVSFTTSEHANLPLPYLAIGLNHEEERGLVALLAVERACLKTRETLPRDIEQKLTKYRSQPEFRHAQAHLQVHLASIEALFSQFLDRLQE